MRVAYGLVYYFIMIVMIVTILLSLLLIQPIRYQVFKLIRRYKISKNQYVIAAKYIVFVVIVAIMLDSMYMYYAFKDNLGVRKYIHNHRSIGHVD